MTDVGSHHFIKSKANGTVLVPQPSQDPQDPLVSHTSALGPPLTIIGFGWIMNEHYEADSFRSIELEPIMEVLGNGIHFICLIRADSFSAGLRTYISGPCKGFQLGSIRRRAIYRNDHSGVGLCKFLMVGGMRSSPKSSIAKCLRNLTFNSRVPLSNIYGRRLVLLASLLVLMASHIWRVEAKSYSSFMGAAALAGIGGAPGEVCICLVRPSSIRLTTNLRPYNR